MKTPKKTADAARIGSTNGSAKWELLVPGQWVLSLPGDAMAAMVTEGLPGRWLWQAQGKEGTAVSRDAAIAAAEANLPNIQISNAGTNT